MQQYHQQDHQEPLVAVRQTLPSFDQSPQASRQADNLLSAPPPDARLEVYLDSICALMPTEVPALSLAEMRREMHDHLDATLTALNELGYTEDEALEHAIVQFGEPRLVAKRWRVEWEETLARTEHRPFWPSLKLALKTWSAMHALALIFWLMVITQVTRTPSPWVVLVNQVMLFGPPIATGMFLGIQARRRPIFATLLGYLLSLPVVAAGVLVFIAVMRVWEPTHNMTGLGTSAYPLLFKLWVGVYFYTLMTLPFSFASVCITALGKSIHKFARRQLASS